MSGLAPSFYTLYHQARSAHHSDLAKLMEQRERFATACLAFALQHDQDFRDNFLRTVCGYNGRLEARDFVTSVEIENFLDLALINKSGLEAFLVEVKIDAELKPKQDPRTEAFLAFGGYGRHIIDAFPGQKTYIVLWQEDESFEKLLPGKLRCITRQWNDLRPYIQSGSSVVNDLFRSLGSFDVRCFAILNPMTDKLKLASKFNDACKVHGVLRDVANYLEELGLPNKRDSSEFDSGGGSYIGWDLTRKSWDSTRKKVHPKWTKYIHDKPGTNPDEISWFGYSDGKLNVGFYCEPRRVKAVRSALKQHAAAGYGEVSLDAAYVWIASKDGGPAKGDKEWFRAIYDHVNNDIDRQRSVRPVRVA